MWKYLVFALALCATPAVAEEQDWFNKEIPEYLGIQAWQKGVPHGICFLTEVTKDAYEPLLFFSNEKDAGKWFVMWKIVDKKTFKTRNLTVDAIGGKDATGKEYTTVPSSDITEGIDLSSPSAFHDLCGDPLP